MITLITLMTMITFAQAQVRIGPGLIAAAASGAFLALPLSGKVAFTITDITSHQSHNLISRVSVMTALWQTFLRVGIRV